MDVSVVPGSYPGTKQPAAVAPDLRHAIVCVMIDQHTCLAPNTDALVIGGAYASSQAIDASRHSPNGRHAPLQAAATDRHERTMVSLDVAHEALSE